MNAREFFCKLATSVQERSRTSALLNELTGFATVSNVDTLSNDDKLLNEGKRTLLRKHYEEIVAMEQFGEKLLLSIPNAEAAYVLRRKYLHAWTMRHIAHDLDVSLRKTYYLQCYALHWLDEHISISDEWNHPLTTLMEC